MGGGVGQMPPEAGPPAGPASPGMMGAGPERGMMGHHPPPRGPGEEHWHHHMMMQSKGAMFYFRRGNSSIMVKCAENESTQVCVNAAATLLDKIRQSGGQQESGGRPPGQ
jgi:hypothetical protein